MADEYKVKQTQVTDEQQQQQQRQDVLTQDDRFNKYRRAYLTQQLKEVGVKDSELDASLSFIDERVDQQDGNLSEVMDELKVRIRADERQAKKYVDPSLGNEPRKRPAKKDGYKAGYKRYADLKDKGLIK